MQARLSKAEKVTPKLSDNDLESFARDGYIHMPGLIPPDICSKALSSAKVAKANKDSSTPQDVSNLFVNTPVWGAVDALLDGFAAPARLTDPAWPIAQMVFVQPKKQPDTWKPPPFEGGKRWHIDHWARPCSSPFSLLVLMSLSDIDGPINGNLTIWPGSHHKILPAVKQVHVEGGDQKVLEEGQDKNKDKLDLGPGTPLQMRTGDVFLIHQKVAHRGTENFGNSAAYKVYVRMASKKLAE